MEKIKIGVLKMKRILIALVSLGLLLTYYAGCASTKNHGEDCCHKEACCEEKKDCCDENQQKADALGEGCCG
jgi:hypothetical protein